MTVTHDCDVLVLGGGNAAMCAAITAREQGRSVIIVECAPRAFRGGNSRHTRNMLGIARLKHGVTAEQAHLELKILAERMSVLNAVISASL